jgi:hypothetical protein
MAAVDDNANTALKLTGYKEYRITLSLLTREATDKRI